MDIWCGCQKRSRQLQLLVRRRASWVLEQVVSFIELGLMLQIWMLQLVPLTSAAAQQTHRWWLGGVVSKNKGISQCVVSYNVHL